MNDDKTNLESAANNEPLDDHEATDNTKDIKTETEKEMPPEYDYTYITGEGSADFLKTAPIVNPNHHLRPFIDDETFENKLHHESYISPKLDLKHDEENLKQQNYKVKATVVIFLCAIIIGLFSGVGYKLADYYILGNESEISINYTPDIDQTKQSDRTDVLSKEFSTVTEIAAKLEPSVVAITSEAVQESLWGETLATSSGSGVIFDVTNKHVYILTNNHVIENSNGLTVNFFGDHLYDAAIVGADPESDLAVIIVKKEDINSDEFRRIRKATLGDSDDIKVGEMAVAIGNPLGYNNTVTVGVISALNRYLSDDLNSLSLIQTDAAINPGNSGGALVNAYGEIIGINTIKISDTAVEGIGFAIPINSAVPIIEELIEKGYVTRPFIGIYGRDVTQELADLYDIPVGVFVSDIIPLTPASQSKLEKFDIIIDIEGIEITTMSSLNKAINEFMVGDVIKMIIMRETDTGFVQEIIKMEIGDRHDY